MVGGLSGPIVVVKYSWTYHGWLYYGDFNR